MSSLNAVLKSCIEIFDLSLMFMHLEDTVRIITDISPHRWFCQHY
jgi:hypothetical protein